MLCVTGHSLGGTYTYHQYATRAGTESGDRVHQYVIVPMLLLQLDSSSATAPSLSDVHSTLYTSTLRRIICVAE